MEGTSFPSVTDHDFISFLQHGEQQSNYPTDDEIRQAARNLVDSVSCSEGIDHADTLIENGENDGLLERSDLTAILEKPVSSAQNSVSVDFTLAHSINSNNSSIISPEILINSNIDANIDCLNPVAINISSASLVDNLADTSQLSFETNHWVTSRCFEEQYCLILQRNLSVSAKGSNTRYRCKFCGFEFVGGPQKIRVHLSGRSENRTRLSKCTNVPDEVRLYMEMRNKSKENHFTGNCKNIDEMSDLSPRNWEESHCVIVSRNSNPRSKNSNSRYRCRYCNLEFTGGPQKIRVHLSGDREGATILSKCPNAPSKIISLMHLRHKNKKIEDLPQPLILDSNSNTGTWTNANITLSSRNEEETTPPPNSSSSHQNTSSLAGFPIKPLIPNSLAAMISLTPDSIHCPKTDNLPLERMRMNSVSSHNNSFEGSMIGDHCRDDETMFLPSISSLLGLSFLNYYSALSQLQRSPTNSNTDLAFSADVVITTKLVAPESESFCSISGNELEDV